MSLLKRPLRQIKVKKTKEIENKEMKKSKVKYRENIN